MAIFPITHAERLAPGSFQQPVPIPATLPGASPLIQICFNQAWLPYILGCLFQLTLSTTWIASDQDALNQVLGQANNLILIFQQASAGCSTANLGSAGANEDYMLRQNPANPCELQSSVDGVTWCTWADLSKCIPQAQQPGNGAPVPPSGGCQSYLGLVQFGSRWLLPVQVSTGDVITITNANGTWASALDLFIPRCPDGLIFFQPESALPELSACIDGTGHTEPGDPAPTINHDSLIAFDGTNYYDCGPAAGNTPVVITVPPGINKANFFFMANTPDTSGFGSVQFDVQLCNNQIAPWTALLDFSTGKIGFTVGYGGITPDDPLGNWIAAQGWSWSEGVNSGGDGKRGVVIHRAISFHCTRMIMTFDYTQGVSPGAGATASFINNNATNLAEHTFSTQPNGTNLQLDTGAIAVDFTLIDIGLITDQQAGSVSGFSGSSLIKTLQISGTGPNPFAL